MENSVLFFLFILTFTYLYVLKKKPFLGQTFKTEFLIEVHGLTVSFCCVCYQHITQKQIIQRKYKFVVINLYHMKILFETFYEDQTGFCTGGMQKHLNIGWEISCLCILVCLDSRNIEK